MRPGGAGRDDRMVRPLEAEFDRHVTASQVDQAPGNEERRYPAGPTLLEHDSGLSDAFDAADAGPDQHAGRDLIFMIRRLPAGIFQRLPRRAHGEHDEAVDLALLLRLHPLVGIERSVGTVTARNRTGDLGRQVGYVECLYRAR